LQVKDKEGKWIDVKVADSIRALIIINLQFTFLMGTKHIIINLQVTFLMGTKHRSMGTYLDIGGHVPIPISDFLGAGEHHEQ